MDKGQGLKNISPSSQIIAAVFPNIEGIRKEQWINYISNVDRIESSTHYNFLNLIDDKIENTLEAKKYIYVEKDKSKTKKK